MISLDQVIQVGTLRRPHGKRGEVQCLMDNEYWDNAEAEFLVLMLDNILVPFRVVEWRGKGSDTLIFNLAGVDTEEKASRLTGTVAYMLRGDLTEDVESCLTWQSLVGYRVVDTDQGDLGKAIDVDESTMNTLITLEDGRLIPIHEDFIIDIDEETQQLLIRLPFEL